MKISELQTPYPIEFEQQDFHSVDGVYIRKIHIPKGSIAPQHAHKHSHCTIVGMGDLHAWKDKEYIGRFKSGEIIEIEALALHTFMSLEDTDIFCVHNEEHAIIVAEGTVEV